MAEFPENPPLPLKELEYSFYSLAYEIIYSYKNRQPHTLGTILPYEMTHTLWSLFLS